MPNLWLNRCQSETTLRFSVDGWNRVQDTRYLSVYHSVEMQQTELSILGNTVKIGALVSQDYKQEVGHLFSGVS